MKRLSGKLTIDEWLFFVAWVLFPSTLILMSTIIYVNNSKMELVLKLVRYVAYGLCVIKIIRHRYSKRELLFSLLLVIIFILSGLGTKNLTYPLYCFIVLASIDIDNTKIIKTTAWLQGFYLVTIIGFSQCGLILDHIFEAEIRARHGLGFSWTTTAPILFFYFSLCTIYIYRKKIPVILLVVLEIVAFWLFKMTDSKMAFLMTTLAVVFIGFESINKNRWKWLSKLDAIYVLFPFLMFGLTILITNVYDWYIPTWAKIDRLMSYRLGLAQNAYNMYGIHLLGTPIPWVGYDYKSILEGLQGTYNYVDSSYLQLAFNNGLIFVITVLFIYSYGIYKAVKIRDYYLVMIYMFILVIALTEPRLMNFAYNPFPLLALGQMSKDFVAANVSKKPRIVLRVHP